MVVDGWSMSQLFSLSTYALDSKLARMCSFVPTSLLSLTKTSGLRPHVIIHEFGRSLVNIGQWT